MHARKSACDSDLQSIEEGIMIVLPSALPVPLPVSKGLAPDLIAARLDVSRSSAVESTKCNFAASIDNIENYIESVFDSIVVGDGAWHQYLGRSAAEVISNDKIPWEGFSKYNGVWTLSDDLEAMTVSVALRYLYLISESLEELLESNSSPETEEKWKQVINLYKKMIGFCKFGQQLNSFASKFEPLQWELLCKIGEACIQIVMLAKLGWAVRNGILKSNTGALARVSIYVVDEMRTCHLMAEQLNRSELVTLKCRNWPPFFMVAEQYATAYAAFFLARGLHHQNKLGEALGLVNYGLVSLQSKKSVAQGKSGRLFKSIRQKMHQRHHNIVLKHLSSILTLLVDESIFSLASEAMVTDIAYLFDLLNELHLTLTSENNSLGFETVVEWQTIARGSKWPLGNKIPVSSIPSYCPKISSSQKSSVGREAYY